MSNFSSSVAKCVDRLKAVFGHLYDEFVSSMIESKAVISGSFVLNYLLDSSEWQANDIDIYVNSSISGYTKIERFLWYCVDENEKNIDFLTRGCYIGLDKLDGCRTYKYKGHKIQVSLINKKITPQHFIENTFDFSILKNWIEYGEDRVTIKISFPTDVVDNISLIKPQPKIALKTVDRVQKYKERGIKFASEDLQTLYNVVCKENPGLDEDKLIEIEKILDIKNTELIDTVATMKLQLKQMADLCDKLLVQLRSN